MAVPPQVNLPFHLVYQQLRQYAILLRDRELFNETFHNLSIQPILMSLERLMLYLFSTGNDALIRILSEAELIQRDNPPFFWVIFLYDPDEVRDEMENAKAFFIRDATQQTDLRVLYSIDEETAIYQINGKFYSRRLGRQNRRHIA